MAPCRLLWWQGGGSEARLLSPCSSSGGVDSGEAWPHSSRLFRRRVHGDEERPLSPCSSGSGGDSCEARTRPSWLLWRRGTAALPLLLRRRGDSGEAQPLFSFSSGGGLSSARRGVLLLDPLTVGRRRRGTAALPFLLWRRRGVATLFPATSAVELRRRGAAALPLLFRRLGGGGEVRTCSSLLPGGGETQCSPLALLGRSMKIALGSIFEGRFPGAGRFSRGLLLN